jgi:hypothetical protein
MNWLSRISYSIALVWASTPCPWAQSDPLKLTVMDADSIPLTQAMVEVGDQIGFTNDLGEWSVICHGATRLRIVAVGFETLSLDPFVCIGTSLTLVMEPLQWALEEAIVEEHREMSSIDMAESLKARDIASVPSSTGIPDLLGSLKMSASVGSNTEGQKGLISRGGNYDQSSLLVDGFPVMNATHLFGMLSMFPTGGISDVRLFVNDKPIEQGYTLGSVVQVSLNESFSGETQHKGKLLSSVIASEAVYQRLGKKAFVQFSGRRSNLEAIQGLIDKTINNKDQHEVSAVYGFDDVSAKGALLLGNHKLEAVSLVSNDRVNYDIAFDQSVRAYENSTRWRNRMAGLGWDWFLGDQWKVEARAGWNDYESELSRTSRVPVFAEGGLATEASTTTFATQIGIRHATLKSAFIGEKIQASFGVQAQSFKAAPAFSQSTNGILESPPPRKNQTDWLNVQNAFVESEVRCTTNLTGSLGLRLARWGMNNSVLWHWLPRASLVLKMSDSQTLALHSGRSIQGLHLLSLNGLGFVPELWVLPSETRPVEQAWQTGLRWTHAQTTNRVSLDLYFRGMDNLLEFRPGVNFGQELTALLSNDVASGGRGAVYGIELAGQRKWRSVKVDMAYAYGRSSRLFETLNDGHPFPFTFDIRHDMTVGVQWEIDNAWALSFTNVFATGRWLNIDNDNATLGMTNPAFGSTVAWTSYALPGNRNGYQLGNMYRMDVSATWRNRMPSGVLQAQLGVYNLTNRINPYAAIWSESANGQPLLEEIGLIPLLPNASLSFTWN